MSGAGENNRWRRSGQSNRQNSNQQNSGASTPTRDGSRQQPAALAGNAWGNQPKTKAAGGGGAPQSPIVQADPHVPLKGFNAGEVKEYLRKRYLESIGGQSSVFHKVQGDSVAKRSSGAWGSRGNMSHLMPNGQEFFTQLKKQLAALDQGKTS